MCSPSDVVNHQPQLQALVFSLFDSGEFSDVLLEVNGSQRLRAHRLLLVTQSSVFRAMLCSPHWSSAQQDMVSLTEEDQCLPHFANFLGYFYSGMVEIDVDSVMPICMLADKYDMPALKECCQEFMVCNVASPPASNRAVSWRQYAVLAGLAELRDACDEFLARNLDVATGSPSWAAIDEEHLCALLRRSDLVTESESVLLGAAADWLRERPERAGAVLQHVRLPMIHPDELYQYQALGSEDEAVHEYIERGSLISYQANAVSVELLGQNHDLTSPPFSMRLYKSKKAGRSLEIGNYSQQAMRENIVQFRSRCLQAQCSWSITTFPHGYAVTRMATFGGGFGDAYRQEVSTHKNEMLLKWRVDCGKGLPQHEHTLNVLLHKFKNGEWFVSDVKAFDTAAGVENRVEDLIPVSERQKYVATDSMRLHFVGQTVWKKPSEGVEEERSVDGEVRDVVHVV